MLIIGDWIRHLLRGVEMCQLCDEMMKLNRSDKNAMLAALDHNVMIRYVSTSNCSQGVIVVEGILGRSITDTINFVWVWFTMQRVFNKIIIAEMNDHVITFDKDMPMVNSVLRGES
jgi:hypothetical protein